jgi:hypothetical protein
MGKKKKTYLEIHVKYFISSATKQLTSHPTPSRNILSHSHHLNVHMSKKAKGGGVVGRLLFFCHVVDFSFHTDTNDAMP